MTYLLITLCLAFLSTHLDLFSFGNQHTEPHLKIYIFFDFRPMLNINFCNFIICPFIFVTFCFLKRFWLTIILTSPSTLRQSIIFSLIVSNKASKNCVLRILDENDVLWKEILWLSHEQHYHNYGSEKTCNKRDCLTMFKLVPYLYLTKDNFFPTNPIFHSNENIAAHFLRVLR